VGAYLLRRVLLAVPTVLGITLVSFTIIALAPGDVASALLSPDEASAAGAASQEALRRELGLNDPFPIRYARWLGNIARGNLGRSIVDSRPVTGILRDSLGLTLQLTLPALAIGVALSLLLGLWTGSRPYTALDNAVSLITVVVAGIPRFVIAILLLYVFAVRLNILPSGGNKGVAGSSGASAPRWEYYVLPVAALAIVTTSHLVRYVRDSVINVRAADYVTTARAKGLRTSVLLRRHVLRNALLPIITITALQIPGLINGALLVETVFGWGGIGSRVAQAIGQRDFPVIMGATLVTGVAVMVANLLADLLYAVADPRIRLR
jgi:peptide/nickel transport system permease protein